MTDGEACAVGYLDCRIYTAPAATGRVLKFVDSSGMPMGRPPPERITLAVLLASAGRDSPEELASCLETELRRCKMEGFRARKSRRHASANRYEGECSALTKAIRTIRSGTFASEAGAGSAG